MRSWVLKSVNYSTFKQKITAFVNMNFRELGAYIIHTVGAPLFVMCFSVLFIFVLLHIEIPFVCLKVYCPYKKKI